MRVIFLKKRRIFATGDGRCVLSRNHALRERLPLSRWPLHNRMALVLQPDSWMPPEEPQSQAPKRATLAEYFAQFANLPDPYLEYDNGYRSWSYTYAQVGAAARGFATRMQQHGIAAGDKVLFWSENRPEWIDRKSTRLNSSH